MYHIIDQTEDFIVIDKFPGADFHNNGDSPGLFATVKRDLKLNELYAVHRLDKITSGLLILAKNKPAAAALSALFQNKEMKKFYLALSGKRPKKKQGIIRGDLKKSRRGAWKLTRELSNPSFTRFYCKNVPEKKVYLFLIRPYTGKTHQIRTVLKSLGAPVLGDVLYEGKTEKVHDRAYLHSFLLEFSLNNKHFKYKSMPVHGLLFQDENIINVIKQFENPSHF